MSPFSASWAARGRCGLEFSRAPIKSPNFQRARTSKRTLRARSVKELLRATGTSAPWGVWGEKEKEAKCEEFRKMYVEFEYLWCTDLNKYFKEFLSKSWIQNLDDNGEPQGKKRLNLDRFDEEIKRFRDVQATVGALHSSTDIDFLRINSQPIQHEA